MNIYKIISAISIFFIFGCHEKRSKDIKRIEIGMNENEVLKIMGKPDVIVANSNYGEFDTIYEYYWKNTIGASSDFIVFFSKKDSTVKYIADGN